MNNGSSVAGSVTGATAATEAAAHNDGGWRSDIGAVPRPEYPRPQFLRNDWLCLNGPWEFSFDYGDSGAERGLCSLAAEYAHTITVPFCPESELSGIGHVDFLHAVWYRKTVTIPQEWGDEAVLLHFGAVDYDATIWVISERAAALKAAREAADPPAAPSLFEGIEVGRHRGGWTPITCDLSRVAAPGDTITIILRARDPAKNAAIARGKQSTRYASYACFYTRTTGIWQTVWMEPVPRVAALKRPRITPDFGTGTFHIEQPLTQNAPGFSVSVTLTDADGVVCTATAPADADWTPRLVLTIPPERRRPWSPSDPHLYDLHIELKDAAGSVVDAADSYAGLRSIARAGKKIKINGEPIFQRLVLDQGYYPDGVLTAPTDDALVRDITLSMEAGFNGARLHQKVFEERFLYHADRLGYLVWGEFPDWGVSNYGPVHEHQQMGITYVAQWLEELERDYSHPSIIGWCALNETHQTLHDNITVLDDATRALFLAAKAMDTTRPVLDTSGYAHRVSESDVYDSHYYIEERDFAEGLEKFRQHFSPNPDDYAYSNPDKPAPTPRNANPSRTLWSIPYNGQPYFVSEFGGFKWNEQLAAKSATENAKDRLTSWGYGSDPQTLEDFYERFAATCHLLMDNPHMFGYCYTQLTDVYPEENGIYKFDRSRKFDTARVRAIQERLAAIEGELSSRP